MQLPSIDPVLHGRLSLIVSSLPELLPRLIPNLTSKARLEALPLLQVRLMEDMVSICTKIQSVVIGYMMAVVL